MISFIRLHKKKKTKNKKKLLTRQKHTTPSVQLRRHRRRQHQDWTGLDRIGSDLIGLDHGPDRESDHINSPFGL